jgi:hypothetical protein
MSGRWSDAGVPHKGWTCVDVEDLGEPSDTCEMCESAVIRYVHHMEHPEYAGGLSVGCVCAERMSDDYVGPKQRERDLRGAAKRREHWLGRAWRQSAKGNSYINTDSLNVVVWPHGGLWWFNVVPRHLDHPGWRSSNGFPDKQAAQLAAFDVLPEVKCRRDRVIDAWNSTMMDRFNQG